MAEVGVTLRRATERFLSWPPGRRMASRVGARLRETRSALERAIAVLRPLNAPELRSPTLGVAMMAQDVAHLLPAALSPSLLMMVDDVVVLDSGSTDNTRDVARALGARVLDVPFDSGGFGAQQTRAVHASAADWVLVLDSDEVASSALLAKLPELIGTPGMAGWWLPRRWVVGAGDALGWIDSPPHWPDYQPRLVRRLPGVRYEGEINQALVDPQRPWGIARGAPLAHLDLILNDRPRRETKVAARMGTPGFKGTEGFYLWEEVATRVAALPSGELEVPAALSRIDGLLISDSRCLHASGERGQEHGCGNEHPSCQQSHGNEP